MTSQTARGEELARLIASSLGYAFEEALADKAEWIALRGEKAGRFYDINEPMQCDYIEAANLVLTSPIIARIEAEAVARGRMEGAKAGLEAVILKLDECCEPCFQCNQNVTALDPAAIVKGLNDAD